MWVPCYIGSFLTLYLLTFMLQLSYVLLSYVLQLHMYYMHWKPQHALFIIFHKYFEEFKRKKSLIFTISVFFPSLLRIQVLLYLFGIFLGITSFQPEKLSYRTILIEMKPLGFPSLRISFLCSWRMFLLYMGF